MDAGGPFEASTSTRGLSPGDRARHWSDSIARTYFPLEVDFADAERFQGEIASRTFGTVGMSRLRSQPLVYRRRRHHLRDESGESILVTIPDAGDIHFEQCGVETRCGPGGYLIERSYEPYTFGYDAPVDLWVLRIELDGLRHRLGSIDPFCGRVFGADDGVGGLFADMARLMWRRCALTDAQTDFGAATQIGEQLMDMLALSLSQGAPDSSVSVVRRAHLARMEAFLRASLARRDLGPDVVAKACGISTRYLHDLLRDTGRTLGEWRLALRLDAASKALRHRRRDSIATIAYELGFADHAQFSRAFKTRFGCTPTQWRAAMEG